jgi:glucose-1-phosphate cytidylyltransferase
MQWPVVILCGGRGARINEETQYKPKPMVEVGDKPILWHIMHIYAHHNFKRFIICLGYKGEVIKNYFLNYLALNSDFTVNLGKQDIHIHDECLEADWEVTLVDTGLEAMTGARIKRIEKYIDTDNFMVTYGDGVTDVNIDKLVRFHQSHGKIGTVTGVHLKSRFGELIVDKGKVIEFAEKPLITSGEGLINGGFFVFKKDFFKYVQGEDDCVLEKKPLEQLASDGELMVYHHKGFWQSLDTFREKELLDELWHSGKAKWKVWR